MKFKTCFMAVLAGAVVLPAGALAQEYGPDDTTSIRAVQEVDEEAEEAEDEPLRWDFRLTNELHTFDNLDLLPVNESTSQDILQTDDRHTFGYTSVTAGASYDVLDDTTFNFGTALSGMWGSDQLGTTTAFGAFAYIYDLSVDWTAVEFDDMSISTTVGRQSFSIGGAEEDFFFKDILDGVTVTADLGMAGRVRLLVLDVFGDSGRPDDVNFTRFINSNKQTTNNFRGDTNVYRYGGVYELLDVMEMFDLRAFAFGSYIGAARAAQFDEEASTGTDRTAGGAMDNFADDDSTYMLGARANYTFEGPSFNFGLMAEYARSGGIDRKAVHLGERDATTNGNAYGAAAHVGTDGRTIDVDGRLRFFRADGSSHTGDEGLLYNHGFVSMKGSQVGGVNMNRYAGWHPSAYVSGFDGLSNNPQDTDRKAGTMTLHAGVGVLLADTLRIDVDGWYYQDTSDTNLDVADAETVANDAAWGQNQAELEAQERLGKTLGTEINTALTLVANDALSFYALGGIFFPGEFYETRIDRTAGTALGAPGGDPDMLEDFWVVSGGTTLRF